MSLCTGQVQNVMWVELVHVAKPLANQLGHCLRRVRDASQHLGICVTTRVRTEDADTDYSVLPGNADESGSARITSQGAFPGPSPVRTCCQPQKECASIALNKHD
jgi:hypothetical protein